MCFDCIHTSSIKRKINKSPMNNTPCLMISQYEEEIQNGKRLI